MINWPAVIKYDGDDELVYVASVEAWKCDAELHLYNHRSSDQLIDSSGRVFSLDYSDDDTIVTEDTGTRLKLDDFIRLVRIHASSSHHCCIEKISFRSFAEGIELVAGMNEQI